MIINPQIKTSPIPTVVHKPSQTSSTDEIIMDHYLRILSYSVTELRTITNKTIKKPDEYLNLNTQQINEITEHLLLSTQTLIQQIIQLYTRTHTTSILSEPLENGTNTASTNTHSRSSSLSSTPISTPRNLKEPSLLINPKDSLNTSIPFLSPLTLIKSPSFGDDEIDFTKSNDIRIKFPTPFNDIVGFEKRIVSLRETFELKLHPKEKKTGRKSFSIPSTIEKELELEKIQMFNRDKQLLETHFMKLLNYENTCK
jgi:hypothetical protein